MTNPILLDMPQRIETQRLILRTPQAGDGAAVHAAILDGYEDYVKWLAWSATPPSAEQVEIDCRTQQAKFILREDMRFLILDKSSNKVMGRCAFPAFQLSWAVPYFGISYFMDRSYRGQGYAQEAANAMARLAFEVLGARKVIITVDPENVASARVPQALNFQLEAKQKGCWPHPNKKDLADFWTYALFDPKDLPDLNVAGFKMDKSAPK